MKRSVDSLTVEDFAKFPMWQFVDDDSPDETCVTPVIQLPVRRLHACVVGTAIRLANGTAMTGVLGNLEPDNLRLTEQFLTLSIFRADGACFHLARYHDIDAAERGPVALAAFLGLPVEAVFPISYDVSAIIDRSAPAVRGAVLAEPRERLTREELISLALECDNSTGD